MALSVKLVLRDRPAKASSPATGRIFDVGGLHAFRGEEAFTQYSIVRGIDRKK